MKARPDSVRRTRDLLRAAVLRGDFVDGILPGERELVGSYSVSRGIVREVLTLLRDEGLIARTQGVGTHVVAPTAHRRLEDIQDTAESKSDSLFNGRLRLTSFESAVISAPGAASRALDVPTGTPCLRVDYAAGTISGDVDAAATNYVLFPEAQRLIDTPFVVDWYAYLSSAGVKIGASDFTVSAVLSDETLASVLRTTEGAPLLLLEQTIRDMSGRVFNYAIAHARPDRLRVVSHSARGAATFDRTAVPERGERPNRIQ